jgi:dipeptidase E
MEDMSVKWYDFVMKLLLTSTGLTNKSLRNKFIEMVGKQPEEMTVAYVPTAINISSSPDKRWAIDNIRRLDDMKIGNIDIVDFSAVPKEVWLPRLEKADAIYVEGGTPSYLKEEMIKAGLVELFNSTLVDKVYVGCSAGSNVLGEKIIKSMKQEPWYKVEDGFGLVDFTIRPHYARGDRTFFDDDKIQQLAKELNTTIYAIDDDSGIAVIGGDLEVISEGKWKRFEK